jgi:hypothetical protein
MSTNNSPNVNGPGAGAPDEPAALHEPARLGQPVRPDEPAPRPLLERIGMASIAAVFGGLFGFVAVAAWVGGEVFLAAMGAIGCLMTLWVGGLTLFRR